MGHTAKNVGDFISIVEARKRKGTLRISSEEKSIEGV